MSGIQRAACMLVNKLRDCVRPQFVSTHMDTQIQGHGWCNASMHLCESDVAYNEDCACWNHGNTSV